MKTNPTPTHSPTETVKAKGKQYKQGGLDALERYLEFQKVSKDHIRFWKEWWLKVLSLDEEVGL